MTFEVSRKRQNLVLQPRGKPLYEDQQSSFGLKMLQSMGWQKGNGLGKNQQGNLEFIQVRYKNNANGLGFDGLKDNQWTETESNFDSLLKHLNSQSNSNSNSDQEDSSAKKKAKKSLEEMSKQSRARVHYKKFTRGKDVFKYSEKDLANIFGKKSLDEDDKKAEEQPEEVEEKPETYKSDLIINTGLSIDDYFKQKKKRKEGDEAEPEEEPPKKKSKKNKIDFLIESHDAATFESKKPKTEKIELNVSMTEEVVDEEVPQPVDEVKKEKKKRKKEEIKEEPVVEDSPEVLDEAPAKKKKKKKSKEIAEEPAAAEDFGSQIDSVIGSKKGEKRKAEEASEQQTAVAEDSEVPSKKKKEKNKNEIPKGANAVYATDVIQIPTHVASKMSNVNINVFKNSNIGDIVGYGMTPDVEIKVVQTKIGEKLNENADKYALYNMDRIHAPRVNPRKIKTKLKKTKKSIQVI